MNINDIKKMNTKTKLGRVDIKTKALRVIEGICLLNESAEEEPFYKIAHVALGTCENLHKDWRKELEKEYKHLKRHKVI